MKKIIYNDVKAKIDSSKIIAKISVGIGRNIKEAGDSLKLAKSKKSKDNLFNIETYSGKNIKIKPMKKYKIVNSYLKLKNILNKNEKAIKYLNNFLYDPKTNLLNSTGYLIKKSKLKLNKKYNKRICIFFDVDNMHELNDKFGYSTVDKYLILIGKTLKRSIRHKREKENADLLETRSLHYRKNDSAGDEFIADIYYKEKNLKLAKKIAHRYLMTIYIEQQKLSKKLKIRN